jgi:hypothetical protein
VERSLAKGVPEVDDSLGIAGHAQFALKLFEKLVTAEINYCLTL